MAPTSRYRPTWAAVLLPLLLVLGALGVVGTVGTAPAAHAVDPSTITGKVTSTTGAALSGISVTAYRVTADGPEHAADVTTGSTGAYTWAG